MYLCVLLYVLQWKFAIVQAIQVLKYFAEGWWALFRSICYPYVVDVVVFAEEDDPILFTHFFLNPSRGE